MDSKRFRMGEFEISAYDSGELRWQSHFGLGEYREGRCFRRGDILFLGPAQSTGPGFLKLEFLDRLERLPAWTATSYYTTCLDIYRCSTGKAVSAEDFAYRETPLQDEGVEMRLGSETPLPASETPARRSPGEANYRLENYQIAKMESGKLVWYSYAGPGVLKSGICIVLEDILFLSPTRRQPTYYSKQKFRSNLRQLPGWDQTAFFCPKFPLRECRRASKLRPARRKPMGDDRQSKATLLKRERIEKFSLTGCQKMTARGSFLGPSSLLGSLVNALKELLTYGASPRSMSSWLQTKMKLTLSFMQAIGRRALRFIINLISITFLVTRFLFTLLKRQYERWLDKYKGIRRR